MKKLVLLLVAMLLGAWSCGPEQQSQTSEGGSGASSIVQDSLRGLGDGLSLDGPTNGTVPAGERGSFAVRSSRDFEIETLLTDLGGGRVPPECGTGVAGVCLIPPVPQNLPSTVTMTVNVRVQWTVRGAPPGDYDALSTPGLGGGILMRPRFVALGTPAAQEDRKSVVARVTLGARPAGASPVGIGNLPPQEVPVELPLEVMQLPVELPTVAVLSVDPNLTTPPDAGYFVLVEENPVTTDCAELTGRVNGLKSTFQNLGVLPGLAPLVGAAVPRLNSVYGALTHQNTQCPTARTVADFSAYVLRHHNPAAGINGLSAEDSLDSVLLFGLPGKRASFFNDRGYLDGSFNRAGGYFELTTGANLFSFVPNLEPVGGTVGNVVPPGSYVERAAPQGRFLTDSDVFANQLSAMGFGDVSVRE